MLNLAVAGQLALVALTLRLARVSVDRRAFGLFLAGALILIIRAALPLALGSAWAQDGLGVATLTGLYWAGLLALAAGWAALLPAIKATTEDEQQLRSELEQLRMVTNSLPLLLVYIDTSRRVQFINGITELWFSVSAEEAQGRHLRHVVGPGFWDVMEGQIDYALTGEQTSYENVPVREGDARHYSINYLPARDGEGAVTGLQIIIEDITDHFRAEEKLRATEFKMTELETIRKTAATYEHEIFNPLAGIIGIAQIMQEEDMPPEDRAEMLGQLLNAARRIQQVTEKLSALEKPQFIPYATGRIDIIKVH
ncbi:PAS domain-containing protein [bacterium]|nr:PAS domain-containing protein [bacterium]